VSVATLLEQTEALIAALQAGDVGRADALVSARKNTLSAVGDAPSASDRELAALIDADARLIGAATTVRNRLADELLRQPPSNHYASAPAVRYFDSQG
jgi:uncharacterized protein YgbK (DUF1537 family)